MTLPSPSFPSTPKPPILRARRIGFLGLALVSLAVTSAVATFLVLTGLTPLEPTRNVIVALLLTNFVFGFAVLVLIAAEIRRLLRARRRGRSGSDLHIRVVRLVAALAALPAVVISVIAFVTLNQGLDNIFSPNIRSVVNRSNQMVEAFSTLTLNDLERQAERISWTLNFLHEMYVNDYPEFQEQFQKISAQARDLSIRIINSSNEVLEDSRKYIDPIPADLPLPKPEFLTAAENETVRIGPGSRNFAGVLMKLSAYEDRYLFVVQPFDPVLGTYIAAAQEGQAKYQEFEARRFDFQIALAAMYGMITLIMLLAAIWMGLAFVNRLVDPIGRLIKAAGEVAAGNLDVAVPVETEAQDLATLSTTFNKMTETLRTQRRELLGANTLLDSRRRFMEAVLSGVSTGVIGIDEEGRVSVLNPIAERLLAGRDSEPVGKPLADIIPDLAPLIADALAERSRMIQGQITLMVEGRERNITVRVTSEQSSVREHGYVVTLDDITELVSAQRSSAWADVARRIAHEIKNPLTPIQLSAERIRRKYGRVITEDREVFDQCTDTIVRQVDDIKRMVDEFSSFARMPKPVITPDDLGEMVKQVIFMMRVANPEIIFEFTAPPEPVRARFDRRLLSQAVTNIIKNGVEAISSVSEIERGQGRIDVKLVLEGTNVFIEVIDNGVGLPSENRQRLLEPYVTTREKGTGLGLAIVGKIMEEHGGGIELLDAPSVASGGRGAMMRLWFPIEGSKESAAA